MEKIVVATGSYPLSNTDMREVNNFLQNGWTVKSVTPQNTKGYLTVIFVLESQNNTDYLFVGKYESNPLWNGMVDFISLNSNGTFAWSLYGGGEGTWTHHQKTITVTPNNGNPACSFEFDDKDNSLIISGRCFLKKL